MKTMNDDVSFYVRIVNKSQITKCKKKGKLLNKISYTFSVGVLIKNESLVKYRKIDIKPLVGVPFHYKIKDKKKTYIINIYSNADLEVLLMKFNCIFKYKKDKKIEEITLEIGELGNE